MADRASLLVQISDGAVDDSVPLASLLQKCIALGGEAGSEKLRDWARQELNGYDGFGDVPDYRRIPVAFMADVTNAYGYNGFTQRIDVSMIPGPVREKLAEGGYDPDEAPLNWGIGELEAMAKGSADTHRLMPLWARHVAVAMNAANTQPNTRISELYWVVPTAAIQGLLVRIRTALVDLVAEMKLLTPADQEVPNGVAADKAVQLVVGDNATINVQHGDHRSTYNIHGAVQGGVLGGQGNTVSQTNYFSADPDALKDLRAVLADVKGRLEGASDEHSEALNAITAAQNEAASDNPEPGRIKALMARARDLMRTAKDPLIKMGVTLLTAEIEKVAGLPPGSV